MPEKTTDTFVIDPAEICTACTPICTPGILTLLDMCLRYSFCVFSRDLSQPCLSVVTYSSPASASLYLFTEWKCGSSPHEYSKSFTSYSWNRTAGEDNFGLALNSVFIRGLAGARENFILKDFLFSKHPTCKLFYKRARKYFLYTTELYTEDFRALKSKASKMKRCYNLITKKNLFMLEFGLLSQSVSTPCLDWICLRGNR